MIVEIQVENLKCNGCATTIKKELALMDGISFVDVDTEASLVKVSYLDAASIPSIKEKLSSLGYPEIDTLRGINKLAANAKSYVSCAVGKFS